MAGVAGRLLGKCKEHRWCLRKGHYEHTLPSIPEDREFGAAKGKGLLLLRLPCRMHADHGGKKAKQHQHQPQPDQADQADQVDQDQAAAQVRDSKSTCKRKLLSTYISESKHQRHKLKHKKQKLVDQKNELLTSSTLPPRPGRCSSNMANYELPQSLQQFPAVRDDQQLWAPLLKLPQASQRCCSDICSTSAVIHEFQNNLSIHAT